MRSVSLPRAELDYVAPPRRPRAAGIALLTISVGIAGVLLARYSQVKLEVARIEAVRDMLAGERRPAQARKSLDDELKGAEAVVRQLALPWAAMVRAVEGASSPDVALLQMQPDAQQRQLRLTAEALTEKAMLAYLDRLAAAQVLGDVHLASHQVMLEEPRRPIQFTVLARLKGAP
jgi:hypothetical protein